MPDRKCYLGMNHTVFHNLTTVCAFQELNVFLYSQTNPKLQQQIAQQNMAAPQQFLKVGLG